MHPGQVRIPEKYWGFTIGKDSFDEVVQKLTEAKAKFTITGFMNTDKFPVIDIQSYQPLDRFGCDITAHMRFGSNNELVKIALMDKEKVQFEYERPDRKWGMIPVEKPFKFRSLSDFFYTEYDSYMKKARVYGPETRFITPDGLKINLYDRFNDKCVVLTSVSLMEKLFKDEELFEKQLNKSSKIQNGRKNADLIK